jgi:hypothetical protein
MHNSRMQDLEEGAELGPLRCAVSAAANDRYWRGAGIEHPARDAGLLYPPMAANLTIMLLQTSVSEPVLHTAERLECHRAVEAGVELSVSGTVISRFSRRGREYAVLAARVTLHDGRPLWTSTATFTPVTP